MYNMNKTNLKIVFNHGKMMKKSGLTWGRLTNDGFVFGLLSITFNN